MEVHKHMIKLNGVSILDFVLNSDLSTFNLFLSCIRPEDCEEFSLTSLLLEDTIRNAKEIIPPNVLSENNLTRNQYLKHYRYYFQNKGTDTGIVADKETIERIANFAVTVPYKLDVDRYTSAQLEIIQTLFNIMATNYTDMEIYKITKNGEIKVASSTILFNGINFSDTRSILNHYGTMAYSWKINKDYIKVKNIFNMLNSYQKEYSFLTQSLSTLQQTSSTVQGIVETASLPPNTSRNDLDVALIALVENGFPGIDLYPEKITEHYGSLALPKDEATRNKYKETYELLMLDMESRLVNYAS